MFLQYQRTVSFAPGQATLCLGAAPAALPCTQDPLPCRAQWAAQLRVWPASGLRPGVSPPARAAPQVPLRSQFGFLLQAQCMGLFRVPSCKADGLATEGTRWCEVFGFLPSSEKEPTPAPTVLCTWAQLGVRAHCPRAGPCLVGTESDRYMRVRSRCVCHCISTFLYRVPGLPSEGVVSGAQVGAGLPCLPVFGCVRERLSAEGSPWWLSRAGAGWTTVFCVQVKVCHPPCVSG